MQQAMSKTKSVADAAGGFVNVGDREILAKPTGIEIHVRKFSIPDLVMFRGISKNRLVWPTVIHQVCLLIASDACEPNMNSV